MGSDFYLSYIKPYAGIIVKICRAYTDNDPDFEDYYQEVCLQIWRSRDRFNGQSEWSTWVYRVCLNVCITYLKKTKTHQTKLDINNDVEQLLVADSRNTENELDLLYELIRQLSEVDRAVILLYLDQHSYQQIAEITGTNANNVGVKLGVFIEFAL